MRSADQIVRRDRFFGHPFVAEHAGFLPRRPGRKAPLQDLQRPGGRLACWLLARKLISTAAGF
jgi:hypothetical protein